MKKFMAAACAVALLSGCGQAKKEAVTNPFMSEYATPFQVPPFNEIKIEHYKPAFLQGMEEQSKEIEAIVNNSEPATFENTIVALDQSGRLLSKVSSVFYALNSANTTKEMQALSKELSPLLSKHEDDITLNAKLFERIKYVYDHQKEANLDKEQTKLLDNTYKDFVRSGANLDAESQQKLRELNTKIAALQLTFGHNVLAETNAFQMVIDKEEDLAGLPENLVAHAAETAKEHGMEGKWMFTQHKPSVMPFLQYSDKRELREKMFKGYINRGNNNNENDNKEVVKELVSARLEKAKLMGFENFAGLALDTRMAKSPDEVYHLLNQIWEPAMKKAKEELADIQAEIKKDGKNFTAEGWDWSYYSARAKKAKYQLDENEVRPYLQLENVQKGLFYAANRLYGITFTALDNIPVPHPDAKAFECKDKDGTHLGVVYFDFFPRAGKKGGAWCGQYRAQTYKDGKHVAPVVTIVTNFTKPTPGKPALLSVSEATTMFHEFGHALHNLFRDVHYYGVSRVPRDFVELPSQVNEHWVLEPEMLKVYAKHYETGEVMPAELVEKIDQSSKYGQGFATIENLAASILDMNYHVLTEIPADFDVLKFEQEAMDKLHLLKQIPPRYRSTYFNHTMGGGYTAGYYSYMWAEVLDCDAYQAYKESGDIFNQEVASKFRKYVLTPGGIDDAMQMYVNFRGREPEIDPILKNRGLK